MKSQVLLMMLTYVFNSPLFFWNWAPVSRKKCSSLICKYVQENNYIKKNPSKIIFTLLIENLLKAVLLSFWVEPYVVKVQFLRILRLVSISNIQ